MLIDDSTTKNTCPIVCLSCCMVACDNLN